MHAAYAIYSMLRCTFEQTNGKKLHQSCTSSKLSRFAKVARDFIRLSRFIRLQNFFFFFFRATYSLYCSQLSYILPLASRRRDYDIPNHWDTNTPQSGTAVAAVRLLWWYRIQNNTCTRRL